MELILIEMSYKHGKASKQDEEDLKDYEVAKSAAATTTAAKKTEETIGKPEEPKQFSGLKACLEDKNISFAEFVSTTEERRKALLGDDYQETKTQYSWLYDQPINVEEE